MYCNLLSLFFFCYINYFSYDICSYFLNYNKNFIEISKTNENRKNYIIKNVVKSVNLCLIIPLTIYILNCVFLKKELENNFVKNFASYYVSNDIVALIKVRKLPKTTVFHHTMTITLLIVNYFIDYENLESNSLAKLLIVYTCFSCYSFMVNTYLGLRFLEFNNTNLNDNEKLFNKYLELLRVYSYYIYITCIILNWTYQIYDLIIFEFNISRCMYIIGLLPIVNDDIILLSWLKKKTKKD